MWPKSYYLLFHFSSIIKLREFWGHYLNFVDSYSPLDYRASGLGHSQILTVFKTKSITNTVSLELRAAELCEVSCKRLLGNKLPFPFYFSYKSKYFHGN